jgi:hypothetical protein
MNLNIKKTRVGSGFYDVEYVDELIGDRGDALSGRIWQAQHLIRILNTESYQNQLQTLLHENLHAMCWEYVVKVEEDEEIIAPLANAFFAFVIDNPKFIQRILDYTKKLKK